MNSEDHRFISSRVMFNWLFSMRITLFNLSVSLFITGCFFKCLRCLSSCRDDQMLISESDWPRPLSSSLGAGVRAVPRGHVAGRLLRNVPCLWPPLCLRLGWCWGLGGVLGGWGCLLFNASVLDALPNGLCGFLNKFVALIAFQVCNCRLSHCYFIQTNAVFGAG